MKNNRELAAILFSDVSGFTNTMDVDEDLAMEQVVKHKDIVCGILKDYNGHLIKDLGDGLFVRFSSALESVQCAMEIQRLTKLENFSIRIGIHLGDVITKNDDVFGSGVNIASRIQGISSADGICMSKEIWRQVKNQEGIQMKSLGLKSFKGVEEKIEVYELSNDKSLKLHVVQDKNIFFSMKKVLFPMTGLILTIIGGIFWVTYSFFDIGLAKPSYSTSIAILELKNIGSKGHSSITEGLWEALITNLSKITNLKVIPRTDIERLKSEMSSQEIAEELDVEYIVEGSVNIVEPDFRVTASLINPFIENTLIWSDDYDHGMSEIFIVLDSISHQIVAALKQKITKNPLLDEGFGGIRPSGKINTNRAEATEYVAMVYDSFKQTGYSKREHAEHIEQFLNMAFQKDCTYAEIYSLRALTNLIELGDLVEPLKVNEKLEEIMMNVEIALQYDKGDVLALAEQDKLRFINELKINENYEIIRKVSKEIADKLMESLGKSHYYR